MISYVLKFIRSIGQYNKDYDIIKADLDKNFYVKTYVNGNTSIVDPVEHYLRIGSRLGYKPQEGFDPAFYMEAYPDVAASGMEPFVHYVKHGRAEHRLTLRVDAFLSNNIYKESDYAAIYNDFDREYYVSSYKDVARAGVDPVGHYLASGWQEGRNPCATFDTRFYLSRYTDVATSGVNPFVHFVIQGRAENRITSPAQLQRASRDTARSSTPDTPFKRVAGEDLLFFDETWYIKRYPEVGEMCADPLRHFLDQGAREGRDPHPLFHTRFYLSQVEDYENAAADPASHYIQKGASLGISPHPLFDRVWYQFGNPDITTSGMDEFAHFVLVGDREGRSSHPLFDPIFYLQNNPDVAAAGIGPLRHFVEVGGQQGRNPHPMFDCEYYHWLHPELAIQAINPLVHYLMQPRELRRHPHPLFDGAVQLLTSALARETSIDPLTDYVQFRSNLDPNLVARHATFIPTPVRAILPAEAKKQAKLATTPLVSVIMPAYNSDERYFRAAVDSIRAQTYSNWELVVVDDGSPEQHVQEMTEGITRLDSRIRKVRLDKNSGISMATNIGLKMATGEFVALVDHDDILVPNAIEEMVRTLINRQADAAYSDQAYLSAWDTFESAFYKPDWSPVMLTGVMYIGHLLVVRREIAHAAGGFDPNFDRVQDFEFMLRVGECTKRIVHVPKILYYWRRIPGSIAHDANSKGKIEPLQAAAVNAHFKRTGFPGDAEPYKQLPHRLAIKPRPRTAYPPVDVLVRGDRADRAIARCLAALDSRRRNVAAISVLGVNSHLSAKPAGTPARRTGRAEGRPVSAAPIAVEIHQAIASSSSRYIVFVDPLVEWIDDLWLDYLLLYAEREDVGFAAPHLYRQDGLVAAAGLLIGENGLLPAMQRFRLGEDGFAGSLACNREVSALPAGMIVIDRTILDKVGGLDSDFSTPQYIFGDAAVRAMKIGYRNIAIANPLLRVGDTYDFMETGTASDEILFQDIHSDVIRTGDPYYNVNFVSGTEDYIT